MDIREQTGLVIRKDKQYVQTESAVIGGTIWSPCAYDALKTRNIRKAVRIASNVGGEIWLFNSITGQLRPADMNKILKIGESKHDRRNLQQAEGNPQERSVETEQESGAFQICAGASGGADTGDDVRERGAFSGADSENL